MQPLKKLGRPDPLALELFTPYTKEPGKAPKSACVMDPSSLRGVHAVRPKVPMKSSKMEKHVIRAYCGPTCAKCVCDWIKHIFLIEKQKLW